MYKPRKGCVAAKHLLAIVFLASTAAVAMWAFTPHGCGLTPDSMVYLRAATSMLQGKGLLDVDGAPLAHYPPGYPIIIVGAAGAGAGLLHSDLLESIRILNALLFGVNIVLISCAVWIVARNGVPAIVCALLSIFSAPLVMNHMMVWSEPPFLTFSLGALILLSRYHVRQRRWMLYCAALLIGCSILTRYVGITLLPPALLLVLLFSRKGRRGKAIDAMLTTFISCAPLAIWLVRNALTASSVTNRFPAFHPAGRQHFEALVGVAHRFIAPSLPFGVGWIEAFLFAGIGALLIWGLAALYRNGSFHRTGFPIEVVLPIICGSFALTYTLFVLASISFLDALTPIDDRIMLPPFVFLMIASISVAWSLRVSLGNRPAWQGFLALALLAGILNAPAAAAEVRASMRDGRGFASQRWKNSPTIALLRTLPKEQPVYSNLADVASFYTERIVQWLPRRLSPVTLESNPEYEEELQGIRRETSAGKAVVAYFYGIGRPELASGAELRVPVLVVAGDGAVYGGVPSRAPKANRFSISGM